MLHASASPSREGWLARTFARLKAAPSAPPPFAPLHTKASRTGPLIALESLHQPVWSPRDYASFSREGMMQNAIVFRAVRMVAEAAASVPLLLYEGDMEIDSHPLIDLLARPNPVSTTPDLLEAWYGYLLVSGNAYLEAVAIAGDIRELHVLRPDRMKVIPGLDGWPEAYEYTANGESVRFAGEVAPGIRPILHLKLFHPANDHYGLSPLEAAATAIDIHNTASRWNKALLDNSARPSGALVYTARDGNLSPDQYDRLKSELEQNFQGAAHAGRPLLLEGGLDWKAMSLTPKDMDFIEAKHVAAREIALAIGVPPMLLGIPGDNTFSNYQEATRSFWRQTVLPLVDRTAKSLSAWLAPAWDGRLALRPDLDAVEALSPEREALWARLEKTSFLTTDEKRTAIGYAPLGDNALPNATHSEGPSSKFNPHHDELGRFTFKPEGDQADVIPAQARGPTPPRFIRPRAPQRPGLGHNQGPSLSEPSRPSQPLEPRQAIEAYRYVNNLPPGVGTIAYGEVDGKAFIGVNSSLPGYTETDRATANAMRDTLIAKYPDVMATGNIGNMPNNALYHAEATALLRAARASDGGLLGRELEIFVDNRICNNCEEVLPLVAREIGNPTIRFRDDNGRQMTIKDGQWVVQP